jgi:DNA-binding FadR family transcriptional regulator
MLMHEEPIQRRKLADEVLDRLLAQLRRGDYEVGATLPSERKLMEMFSVGRPAVREALQALERLGFIKIVHGEGARVLPLSVTTAMEQISETAVHLLSNSEHLLEHLKEARMAFEVGMARMAAENGADEGIAALREALEANRESVADQARFQATDMAFHRAIAAVSGNPIYSAVSRAMLEWLEKFHTHLIRNVGAERQIFAEHEKIFERIVAHDPDGAAEAMVQHLTRASQMYQRESHG